MTTAERLRAEGRAQGRAQGRAEGRTEARTEGHVEVLLGQLSTKFGPIPAHIRDRIRSADVAHLLTWSQRLLTATTLDEVFTEP